MTRAPRWYHPLSGPSAQPRPLSLPPPCSSRPLPSPQTHPSISLPPTSGPYLLPGSHSLPLFWVPRLLPPENIFFCFWLSFPSVTGGGGGLVRPEDILPLRSYRMGVFSHVRKHIFYPRWAKASLCNVGGGMLFHQRDPQCTNIPKQAQPAEFLCWDREEMESYQ